MKDKNIPLIEMDRINEHPDLISYIDNDIAVIDSLSNIIETDEEVVKLNCLIIAFCQEGSLTIHINGQQHLLEKDHCAILPTGTILRKAPFTHPYNLKVAVISQSFLSEIIGPTKESWHIFHYIFNHPIFPVKQSSSYKMYLYKELMLTLIQEEQHEYSKKTRRYHFAGLFCEMMATLHQMIPESQRTDFDRKRSISIVREFMNLVIADDGSHRSVSYYADRLCYTPKYLSSVIKQVTDKTPLQIIHEHTIKKIKHQLKHSDMSIKEIADFFDFPNPSFFGKYVKAHTGMPPQQYRISEEIEK